MKTWEIRAGVTEAKHLIELLLKNRGLKTRAEQAAFLQPKSPAKLTLTQIGIDAVQMAKAKRRLMQAKRRGEEVVVYGDYDADGICATAIMWEALHGLGMSVWPFIPHREEHGYGLSIKGLGALLKERRPKLIVTVDNGIVAYPAIEAAYDQGIDVIVTDHHQPGKKLPVVVAIIHTTKLAGAGVAWMVANQVNPLSATKSLDLAALGTVADMVELLGANRQIVAYGLKQLKQTPRPGLQAMYAEATIEPATLDTYVINFVIAPRLNASGRVSSALDAVRLVCTKDAVRAKGLARALGDTNRARQQLLEEQLHHARERVKVMAREERLLIVADESYHQGIIGLIAGKLTEEFYRPSVVMSVKGEVAKASARSIAGFNIIEAIRATEDLVMEAGGHPMAAGFSVAVEKLETLTQRLQTLARAQIDEAMLTPKMVIEAVVEIEDINLKLYQAIAALEPFGVGNPRPVLGLMEVEVEGARLVGKNSQHLKLKLKPLPQVEAIGFNLGERFSAITPGQKIDVAFTVDKNVWNGQEAVQLIIKDLRPSQ